MRYQLRAGVAALALLAAIGFASAQTSSTSPQSGESLTAQQREQIRQGLANQPNDSAPSGFQAQVGQKVPDGMTAHQMPNNVSAQVPASKELLFIKLPDRVLLIDPQSKMIAQIVPASQ
jgi:hypothetical protein